MELPALLIINHYDSPYYKIPNFSNMENSNSRIILKNFKTMQQSTEITCGACSVLMILNYFGITDYSELELSEKLKTKAKIGTSIKSIVKLFKELDFMVTSSLSHPKFKDYVSFRNFVISALKSNIPILVENVDWGGHWRVIIGIDTMSEETTLDDTLILADPYNTHNHNQDGFCVENGEKFFSMFFDHDKLPENERNQPWILAFPKDL